MDLFIRNTIQTLLKSKAIVVYDPKYVPNPKIQDKKDFNKNAHLQLHNFLTYLKTANIIDRDAHENLTQDMLKYGYLPLKATEPLVDIIFKENKDLLEYNDSVL